jgi:hypothetical protein
VDAALASRQDIPDHPKYRGLAVPVAVARAEDLDPYAMGWKDGVDAHYHRTVASQQDIPAEVLAFEHVVQNSPNAARSIVRDMSGQDRAVLSFYLSELSRLVDDEELIRTAADRRAARPSHPDAI